MVDLPDGFASRSLEYRAAYLKMAAELALERKMPRPPAAATMRNDAEPRTSRNEFREDRHEPARPAFREDSAMGAKMRMLQKNGMNEKAAAYYCGLTDTSARAEHDAQIKARYDAAEYDRLLKRERELIEAGLNLRHDAADNRSNARASRERMIYRQDLYCHERTSPEQRDDYRADAAPLPRNSSAAEARARMYSRGV